MKSNLAESPNAATNQALEGVKIVEFTIGAAGAATGKFLADHGAEVIRVESSARVDSCRVFPPYKDGIPGPDRGAYYLNINNNKYGIALNLKHPKARELAVKLITRADIVIENFRPGVMGKWGLGWEQIRQFKPDLVMLSSSNLGQTGPMAQQPGFGVQLVALAGYAHITGWADRPPLKPYGAYTDWLGVATGVIALMAALEYRQRTGKGQLIDLSQYECSLYPLFPSILDYFVNGQVASRAGNHSFSAAPHGAYRCQGEDRWCAIAVCDDDKWKKFCEVINMPALARDERFVSPLLRRSNSEELDRLIEAWTIWHSPEDVMNLMQRSGIAAGVVQSGEDLYEDPQLKEREHLRPVPHSELGSYLCAAPPYGLSRTPCHLQHGAPSLGEHTEFVCTQILGMSTDEFVGLLGEGVFE